MTWIVSLGWCECGATLGKTQIDGRWYWMHDGVTGALMQDDAHTQPSELSPEDTEKRTE